MASTLAPQPLLRQTFRPPSNALHLAQRSLQHARQAHPETPSSLSKRQLRRQGYRKFKSCELEKREIRLWNGNDRLGIMNISTVMESFLAPGKMLCWRPAHEILWRLNPEVRFEFSEMPLAETGILNYEVITISGPNCKLHDVINQPILEKGVYQVFLQSNTWLDSAVPLSQLTNAFNLLQDPRDGAQYSVEFHIAPPRDWNNPCGLEWALKNRLDLHPAVIMEAMPYGVRYTRDEHRHRDGTDVFWSCVGKFYDPWNVHVGKEELESLAVPPGQEAPYMQRLEDNLGPEVQRLEDNLGPEVQRPEHNLGPEVQMEFERAFQQALTREKAVIRREFRRYLGASIKQQVKVSNGGSTAPIPELMRVMRKKERATIERAVLEIRRELERKFGIEPEPTNEVEHEAVDEPKPTDAVEDNAVDELESVLVSARADDRPHPPNCRSTF